LEGIESNFKLTPTTQNKLTLTPYVEVKGVFVQNLHAPPWLQLQTRQHGQDTRPVQHYLGHKNIQHTVRYSEL
jgi:hypothetical protein